MMDEISTNNDKGKLSTDSEGLGAWGDKTFVVGHVSEVNGSEAYEEVPEFVPTKHELIQIAKYWFLRQLENDFFFFVFAQTGSSEWRESVYASRRINRIAQILSEPELNQVIEEVERDFKREHKISDADWDTFKNGTMEQWESYAAKTWQEFECQQADTTATE